MIWIFDLMLDFKDSKREVLEIFNINKNNAIGRFLFWNRQPIGQ